MSSLIVLKTWRQETVDRAPACLTLCLPIQTPGGPLPPGAAVMDGCKCNLNKPSGSQAGLPLTLAEFPQASANLRQTYETD
jgi:hypothetical protein